MSLVGETQVVWGVHYTAVAARNNGCIGCAARDNRDLCNAFGDCVGVIWQRSPATAPTAPALAPSTGTLPSTAADRKATPMATGLLDYFPLALAAVARCSAKGNEQHHPGTPLHWDREKSTDHADCLIRHMVDRDKMDTDGEWHATKAAWRALAFLQVFLEQQQQKEQG